MLFVNDHLQNFAYSNLPAFCVGLASEYDAPSEGGSKLMRISPRKLRGHPEWSMALLERGLASGIDFAYSYEIESWDEPVRTAALFNKALTGIARQHLLKDALTEDDLAGHELSEAERAALKTGDIGKLYDLGANPYLIRRVFRRRFAI